MPNISRYEPRYTVIITFMVDKQRPIQPFGFNNPYCLWDESSNLISHLVRIQYIVADCDKNSGAYTIRWRIPVAREIAIWLEG